MRWYFCGWDFICTMYYDLDRHEPHSKVSTYTFMEQIRKSISVSRIDSSFIVQSSLSESLISSSSLCIPCGLQHVSSAMQVQASVQERLTVAQLQLVWHSDLLHAQVVNSRRLLGAGSFVIRSGCSSPSSITHPCPTGDGICFMPSREHQELARWMCCCRLSEVGWSASFFCFFNRTWCI